MIESGCTVIEGALKKKRGCPGYNAKLLVIVEDPFIAIMPQSPLTKYDSIC